jgi:hypothetical protein
VRDGASTRCSELDLQSGQQSAGTKWDVPTLPQSCQCRSRDAYTEHDLNEQHEGIREGPDEAVLVGCESLALVNERRLLRHPESVGVGWGSDLRAEIHGAWRKQNRQEEVRFRRSRAPRRRE